MGGSLHQCCVFHYLDIDYMLLNIDIWGALSTNAVCSITRYRLHVTKYRHMGGSLHQCCVFHFGYPLSTGVLPPSLQSIPSRGRFKPRE